MATPNDWRRVPESAEELTRAQRLVLLNAWEGESLVDILNATDMQGDDPIYWNRKWKYVPEIAAAALSMLEFGFIEVHRGSESLANSVPLTFDAARAVLEDPTSWWTFDPDDVSDPVETAKLLAAGASTLDHPEYWISETPVAPPFGAFS